MQMSIQLDGKTESAEGVAEDDGEWEGFRPGDLVSGRALLDLEAELAVDKVELAVKGKAKVSFEGLKDHKTAELDEYGHKVVRTTVLVYKESGTYVDLLQLLWDPGPGQRTLGRGRHEMPFTFHLPSHIPCSYAGVFGKVSYKAVVRAQRPGGAVDKASRGFHVEGRKDLAEDGANWEPRRAEAAKRLRLCWCLPAGSLGLTAGLAQTGFVPGQQVLLDVRAANESRRPVARLSVRLLQLSTVKATATAPDGKADKRTDTQTEVLHSWDLPFFRDLPPGQIKELKAHPLRIPRRRSIAAALEPCNFIKARHELHVGLETEGGAEELGVRLPVVLGTEAVRGERPQPRPQQRRAAHTSSAAATPRATSTSSSSPRREEPANPEAQDAVVVQINL